jgi:pilus assembly protein CpaC
MIRRSLRLAVLALSLAGPAVLAWPGGIGPAAAQTRGTLTIEPGGGQLVTLPQAAATVFAADPRVARVQAASPTTLFISGVARGRTVVVATAADGSEIASYEVTVGPPPRPPGAPGPAVAAAPALPALEAAIRSIVPGGTNISVRRVPGGVMLSGEVPTAADAQRAFAIARSGLPEGERVLDQLRIGGAMQVNLRVRVAEVSRTITRELGFNWQALGSTGRFAFGLLTGAFAGAQLVPGLGGEAGRNFIAGGYRSTSFDINGLIDALAADQLISILAEPNLTAQSGETASFLAGGEFPVPVAAQNDRITIEFKQFGVSLAFVPTVMDASRISLKVRPEVSELSEEGAISLPVAGGVVRIPALRVRRAETTVELGSGQSFAIAGLLQDGSRIASSGLPFLGDIPVLGALFRSDRFRRNDSELVIIITPYLVRPVSDPGRLALPTDGVRPANDIERILFHRQLSRETPPPRVPGQIGFIVE